MAGIPRELTIRALYRELMEVRELEPEGRVIFCKRCSFPVSAAPASAGAKRRRDHPRTVYRLAPPFGDRALENVVVLCGMCVRSYKYYGPFRQLAEWELWIQRLEEDEDREASKEKELEEMERILTEDVEAAGPLTSEGLNRTIDMPSPILPEVREDFDVQDVTDTAKGTEEAGNIDDY